jgi:uncharacterized protein
LAAASQVLTAARKRRRFDSHHFYLYPHDQDRTPMLPTLRDAFIQNPAVALGFGGLLIGMALGAIVFRTNFCAMGAISDLVSFGDTRRLRAWVLAAATALIGTQLLARFGVVDLTKSMYLAPAVNWAGNLAGGALFGFGMVFAGGCGTRNLVRAGGGDLKALITLLVLGISAYITMTGVLGPLRAGLEQLTALPLPKGRHQGLDSIVSGLTGSPAAGHVLVPLAVALALLVYCFISRPFRASRAHIVSGLGVGLCIVAGWAVTGLAFDDLADKPSMPVSLTFVRPAGDTLEWLQRFTALGAPGFGVASVFGTLLGAFLTAVAMGRFRVATFSGVADTRRTLGGAMLMGIGGITALGCTVGQGITGISTLSLGSFLTFAGLIAGGILGIKTLERLLMAE